MKGVQLIFGADENNRTVIFGNLSTIMWTTVVGGGMRWCIVYMWWEIVVYFRNKVYGAKLLWKPAVITPLIVVGFQSNFIYQEIC